MPHKVEKLSGFLLGLRAVSVPRQTVASPARTVLNAKALVSPHWQPNATLQLRVLPRNHGLFGKG